MADLFIIRRGGSSQGGGTIGNFTYSGQHEVVYTTTGPQVRFLTSGTLIMEKDADIDVFIVGGGASGSAGKTLYGGGGGSGYTTTQKNIRLKAGEQYPIIIGAGGNRLVSPANNAKMGNSGGASSAFGYTANGASNTPSSGNGGKGGSGGGAGGSLYSANNETILIGGYGGEDGANGYNSRVADGSTAGGRTYSGGDGQDTTTRAFGEKTGQLYAGGGGGAGTSGGGAAGGGTGGGGSAAEFADQFDYGSYDGTPNTGGGGGGSPPDINQSGAGGSGVVIIRHAKG